MYYINQQNTGFSGEEYFVENRIIENWDNHGLRQEGNRYSLPTGKDVLGNMQHYPSDGVAPQWSTVLANAYGIRYRSPYQTSLEKMNVLIRKKGTPSDISIHIYEYELLVTTYEIPNGSNIELVEYHKKAKVHSETFVGSKDEIGIVEAKKEFVFSSKVKLEANKIYMVWFAQSNQGMATGNHYEIGSWTVAPNNEAYHHLIQAYDDIGGIGTIDKIAVIDGNDNHKFTSSHIPSTNGGSSMIFGLSINYDGNSGYLEKKIEPMHEIVDYYKLGLGITQREGSNVLIQVFDDYGNPLIDDYQSDVQFQNINHLDYQNIRIRATVTREEGTLPSSVLISTGIHLRERAALRTQDTFAIPLLAKGQIRDTVLDLKTLPQFEAVNYMNRTAFTILNQQLSTATPEVKRKFIVSEANKVDVNTVRDLAIPLYEYNGEGIINLLDITDLNMARVSNSSEQEISRVSYLLDIDGNEYFFDTKNVLKHDFNTGLHLEGVNFSGIWTPPAYSTISNALSFKNVDFRFSKHLKINVIIFTPNFMDDTNECKFAEFPFLTVQGVFY